jgi:hypothetical protein
MTTVVSIKDHPDFNAKRSRNDNDPTRNPNDVYIGRYTPTWSPYGYYQESPWHNPYVVDLMDKKGVVIEKRDGTRAKVIEKFLKYAFGEPCVTFKGKTPQTPPDLLAQIPNLKGKRLGCWCKPEDCHGDLLAAWADDGIPPH